MKGLAGAIAALLWLHACQPDETVTGYGGAGDWHLDRIGDTPVSAEFVLHLDTGGGVRVDGPCTRFDARQTAPYPWFRLDDPVQTPRGCSPDATEARTLAILNTATLVEVAGDALILSGESEPEIGFVRRD
ncbi:MAG: META domain-containing protein [Roseovarius sp.]|nr:META domain-containing protein [Roseovarius sp.]